MHTTFSLRRLVVQQWIDDCQRPCAAVNLGDGVRRRRQAGPSLTWGPFSLRLPWQVQTSIFTRLLEADASPNGSPMQRITFYTLKALDMRRKAENLESTRGPYEMTPQVCHSGGREYATVLSPGMPQCSPLVCCSGLLAPACVARWRGGSSR